MVKKGLRFRILPDDSGEIVAIVRNDRDVLRSASRLQRWLVAGMCPFALAFVWLPLVRVLLPQKAEQWVVIVLGAFSVASFLVGFFMLLWLSWPSRANRRIAAWRARRNVCGACEYPLNDLDTSPTGLIRCPECGAHWRRAAVAD